MADERHDESVHSGGDAEALCGVGRLVEASEAVGKLRECTGLDAGGDLRLELTVFKDDLMPSCTRSR